jgi:hypothetical protein
MGVLTREKLQAVAERLTSNLRDHLEWRDGERVASVREVKPGTPLAARLDLRDDHLQDLRNGDGYERLGKRLAFKLMPELRKRMNGYKADPEKNALSPDSEPESGYVTVEWTDSPFLIRLKARECRWRDDNGYNRGAGELLAEVVVIGEEVDVSSSLALPRFERPPRPVNPITHVR